ncbi:hypothetical protein [Oceanospirillum phage vB_OsaM_PD0307]|nr:hypothetical protein [Oceanospirillum phage vB_OsaM_PD0307]
MNDENTRHRFECECNGATLSEAKRALADYCKNSGQTPAKALALLASELMLSGEVYGPDFAREVDQAMLEGANNART